MKILAIETSCDETAIAVVESNGDDISATFSILSNTLISQIDLHKEYGGVYPSLAKREHTKNIIPLVHQALDEAGLLNKEDQKITPDNIEKILEREPELSKTLHTWITQYATPNIDAIAVTMGPGLSPALWVGVNTANALASTWNIPLIPINHMEGHILASLVHDNRIENVEMPLLALLISGGHTELVLMKDWRSYTKIGATLDDAVGEAFDKVARMLDLPYPGGPEISKLAEIARTANLDKSFSLPRPILTKPGYDFSFAGLKTAVLYLLKKKESISEDEKNILAREFEDAVTEVLLTKTISAVEEHNIKTVVLGGGVSANTHIRKTFTEKFAKYPNTKLYLPERSLSTDNAVMIALAGFYAYQTEKTKESIEADSNLSL